MFQNSISDYVSDNYLRLCFRQLSQIMFYSDRLKTIISGLHLFALSALPVAPNFYLFIVCENKYSMLHHLESKWRLHVEGCRHALTCFVAFACATRAMGVQHIVQGAIVAVTSLTFDGTNVFNL